MKKIKSPGFTLVELIIVLGIFSLILGMLFSILISQNNLFNQVSGKADVARFARKAMNIMVKELRMADMLNVSLWNKPVDGPGCIKEHLNGKSVTFQVPVDWDKDGDMVDDYLRLEWGADGQLGSTIEYCWIASEQQILRRVWDSADELVSSEIVVSNISNIKFTGLKFDATKGKYFKDADPIEVVEISLTAQKSVIGGRTLANPITFSLRNEVYWRN